MFVYTCGIQKKKKSTVYANQLRPGGTTNHRRGGKSVGVKAGCVFFFFFFLSTEIPTNAMLCHTIPYHILLEITFPPLTALLGDSPILLSAYSVSAARCHERTRVVTSVLSRTLSTHRMIDITLLHPRPSRLGKRTAYISHLNLRTYGCTCHRTCYVLYRQKEQKEKKDIPGT